MRSTISFNFYCRASKADRKGESPIEVSIIINGSRKYYTLQMRCKSTDFNKKRKPKVIEDYISAVRNNINKYITELTTDGTIITSDIIYEAIKNGGIRRYTIKNLFDDYEALLMKRIGVDMDENHFRKYTLTRELFFTTINQDAEATTISNAHILAFKALLNKQMKESTAGGYMSRLKAYIRFGINNGKLHINPFEGVKIKRVEKPVETITSEELDKIMNKEFASDRLDKVRDIFVFSCGCGLAFTDVMHLEKKDVIKKDGRLCIFKQRVKTDVDYYSVLLPCAVDVWNKYDGCLPNLSNQKTNEYLKEIQEVCGVQSVSKLHYHLARHYYATNAINSGVPIEVVQKLCGWKSIKQALHYAKMMKSTVVKSVIENMPRI